MKYFLLLIIILLLKGSEELNSMTRIEEAVKLALLSLENISGFTKSFTLKYSKYKIDFSNFRIISPTKDNITLSEKNNDSAIYIFKKINFGFIFDITIHFHDGNKYTKKDNYLNTTFSYLNFTYDSTIDFLSFDSFGNISSDDNILNINIDISSLNYFKEFNEEKTHLSKIGNEKGYKLRDQKILFLEILQGLTKEYITKVENLNILLSYDAYIIFNNTLGKIECSKKISDSNHIEYIKMNKILIPSNEISIQPNFKKKLWIHQIYFYGVYYSSLYKQEIDFRFQLDDNEQQVITLIDRRMTYTLDEIIIFCNFCTKHNEEWKSLELAIKTDYKSCLDKSISNYYK